jgi:phage terminase large subunit
MEIVKTVSNEKAVFIENSPLLITKRMIEGIKLASNPKTEFISLEGTARSIKTALAIQMFYYRVIKSSVEIHVISAMTLSKIFNDLLFDKKIGLIACYPFIRLVKGKIGSAFVEIPTKDNGVKKVLLATYDNKSSWKKALGGERGVVFVDECNIADMDFLRELFARQTNVSDRLTIYTLNGDDPNHPVYNEFINYGLMVGDNFPVSTRNYISEFRNKQGYKKGWYSMFFNLYDNPTMTAEKIDRFKALYPPGSHYYTTKFLGERGVQGDLIFNDYMKPDLMVDAYEKINGIPKYDIFRYTIGVDIGSKRAYSSFALVGWTKNYETAIILNVVTFKQVGYAMKVTKLTEWLNIINSKGRLAIEGIFVDSAEQNFIDDLKPIIKQQTGFEVGGSYKATIKDRIDTIIIGLSNGSLLFHKDSKNSYDAYKISKWQDGKKGIERQDEGLEINDIMDSVEYALSRHFHKFRRNI